MTSPASSIDVLYVGGEPDATEVAADHLEREDEQLTVRTVITAEEGMVALADQRADCIVSEYDMPHTDGLGFLELVREEYPELPFILYTANGSEAVASEAISGGVTEYLRKTEGTDQYTGLVRHIHKAVANRQADRTDPEQIEQFVDALEGYAVFMLDTDGRITSWNAGAERKIKYPADKILGEHISVLCPDEQHSELMLNRALREGSVTQEVPCLCRNGSTFQAESVTTAIFDEDGEHCGYGVVAKDITERAERERELERYERILETTGDPVYLLDSEGNVTYANEAFTDLTGYETDALLGEHVSKVMSAQDVEQGEALIRSLLTTDLDRSTFEMDLITANGQHIPCENNLGLLPFDDEFCGTVGILRDISARKQREWELERERQRFATLFQNFPEPTLAIDFVDEEPIIESVNDSFEETFGISSDEGQGESVNELIVPEGMADKAEAIDEQVKEDVLIDVEVRREVNSGLRYFNLRDIPVPVAGSPDAFTVYNDITEQKERQLELERLNDLFEQAQHIADMGAWEFDVQTEEIWWTDQVNRIYGLPTDYKPDPGQGLNHIHPDDLPRAQEAFKNAVEEGEFYELDVRAVTPDEDVKWVRIQGDPQFEDGAVLKIRGTIQDITDRKEREDELERQNEQLEEFANVLSHDLRNPLSVASGRLDLVRDECDSEHLEHIETAHDRMETLIGDLLTLARQGDTVAEFEEIALEPLLNECWSNVQTGGATLDVDLGRTIQGDRSPVKQFFENLFRNALEHGDEEVTITVGELDDGFYVADDGDGIPEGERDEVFEAGYSTSDHGTGFGLSIVNEICQAHGWEITVTESAEGGARFDVTGVEFVDD